MGKSMSCALICLKSEVSQMRTVLSSHVQRNRPHGVTLMSVTGAAVSRSRATLPLRGSHNLPCMYVCMTTYTYVERRAHVQAAYMSGELSTYVHMSKRASASADTGEHMARHTNARLSVS